MDLEFVGKHIVGTVAKPPFCDGNRNVFCKIIPLFDVSNYEDYPLPQSRFLNDGEIWWRVIRDPKTIIPGALVEFTLEEAPGADAAKKDASLYQANFLGYDSNCLGKEGGAEIFCLPNETEQSILRFRKEDEKINLPHVPSKEVYFEVENFIYGPFFTSFSLPDNPCCVEVTIKPPYDKKVFKVSLNEFEQNYCPFVLKSTNRLAVYDDSKVASFEYKILHPQYLKKLEHERDSKWKLLDFELLSSKVRRLIGSSGCLSRNESRTLSDLLKKLESQVTLSTNPIALKELLEKVQEVDEDAELALEELAKYLLSEERLLPKEQLDSIREEYLQNWISTQNQKVHEAIEREQKNLDRIKTEIQTAKAEFELEKKRQKNELNDEEEKRLQVLAVLEKEAKEKIDIERQGWEREKKEKFQELEDKQCEIQQLLNQLEEKTRSNAESIIAVYPFLKNASSQVYEKVDPEDKKDIENQELFRIPEILNSRCKASERSEQKEIEFFRHFQAYVASKGFSYSTDDLRRFHISVKCGSITVLAGPSGVGKSSLAMLYGNVLAGDNSSPRDGTHMIHVSPSWLEKSDLLGYVNTITRDFAPAETGLYQQLIYAQEDYKRNNADSSIYPICLDEMNLAQIEYYFSDFMQILELPQENQKLTCFSPQAVVASSIFKNYSSIKLSPALRFIGTVNFDETTKRLSMRLLDRINLIQLSNCSEFWDPRCENVTAGDGVSYANYSKWIRDESLPANIEAYLAKLANPLQQLGVVISPRVKFAIGRYVASSNPFFDNRNDAEKSAFDEQIAQRVLSKIRSVRGQRSALDEISKIILDFCQGMQCEKILKQLREQDEIWSDSLLGED